MLSKAPRPNEEVLSGDWEGLGHAHVGQVGVWCVAEVDFVLVMARSGEIG